MTLAKRLAVTNKEEVAIFLLICDNANGLDPAKRFVHLFSGSQKGRKRIRSRSGRKFQKEVTTTNSTSIEKEERNENDTRSLR